MNYESWSLNSLFIIRDSHYGMFFLFIFLLIVALVLEGSVTTLPLVFVVLLCWGIVRQDRVVFPVAFFAGLFLDVMTLHPLGTSSSFFVVTLFLAQLYQRKYEIMSYPFVFVASFIGSLLYLLFFGATDILLQSGVAACIGLILFFGATMR